jgi:hypothetical protein
VSVRLALTWPLSGMTGPGLALAFDSRDAANEITPPCCGPNRARHPAARPRGFPVQTRLTIFTYAAEPGSRSDEVRPPPALLNQCARSTKRKARAAPVFRSDYRRAHDANHPRCFTPRPGPPGRGSAYLRSLFP